jgi:hypothetical protein
MKTLAASTHHAFTMETQTTLAHHASTLKA